MSITFSGLATGLDTDSIVKDLMAIERAPLERVEAKKTDATKRLEAFAQFKSKLDGLKTAASNMSLTSQVRSTKVSLSSDEAFTATTSSGAVGSYNISVVQLSQVQKSITGGFSSNSASILGTGTITVNGTAIEVTAENNSLLGLAKSINDLSAKTGVQVSIINDGKATDPYHLVFTGKDAQTSFSIESTLGVTVPGDLDFTTTKVQDAQQAMAIIDGITVVGNTNTITDAISGVSLNLNSVSDVVSSGPPPVYATARMDIEADTDALKEKVTSFVTAYNGVMEWILSGYEEFGGSAATSSTSADDDKEELLGSVLRGDPTINSVKRKLQGMLTETINNSGSFRILSEIGVTSNVNGTLNQDNTTLDTALADNFDDMVNLLSGDDETKGVMKKFNSLLLDLTSGTKGVYATKKTSYDNAVKRFDSQIDVMEMRLTKREKILRSQFTAMEALVSSLNAQGDFLTQHIDALNRDK